MNEINFWTYSKREISDLKPEFENEFQVKLIRDYENVWEWIWNGNQPNKKINISREHNYKTGEYSKPLRIKISWNNSELQSDEITAKIQRILKSDLFIGTIQNRGINLEDYIVSKTIKYET